MNFQSISVTQVTALITTALGLVFAAWAGTAVAEGQMVILLAIFSAVVGISIFLLMGQKIWLLIPLCWLLTGKISVLPLPFTVRDLGVLAAFGAFLLLRVYKKLPQAPERGWGDYLVLVNLAYLATVFARNPAGLSAFASDTVGARPYFDIAVAFMAYWVLQHIALTPKQARLLPLLMSIGAAIVAFLGVLTMRIPALVPIIAPFYSGLTLDPYLRELRGDTGEGDYRVGSLQAYSTTVGLAMVSYFNPANLLLPTRLLYSMIFYSTAVAILLSGFRSGVAYFGVIVLLSSYFYAGFRDVIKLSACGLLGVLLIIFLQVSGFSVHPAAQRALSFIPAGWDEKVVSDAEASSEWRFDMWKVALENDKYINNKILGDGFGFSAYELNLQQAAAMGGVGYFGDQAEAFLVQGAFHSGSLSAIRYAGVIGLVLFMAFLVYLSVYAWKLVVRAKGTYVFPLALFAGLPAIYKPFEYLFIFGGFDSDYPKAILTLGMLNLVSRTLDTLARSPKVNSKPVVSPLRPALAR